MKMLLVFGVVLLAFSKMAQAGTVTKCDVVRALRNENVPDSEIRDCKWTKKTKKLRNSPHSCFTRNLYLVVTVTFISSLAENT